MAAYRTEAIVLRVQPFAEADRLATLLSPEQGRIRAIARGAQRGRSILSAAVQPFVRARLLFWRGRQLDGISQAEIIAAHGALSGSMALLASASYCCDLADAFSVERQEAPALFRALGDALDQLCAEPPAPAPGVVLRWYELHCLDASGFLPELHACTGCGAPLGEPSGRTRLSAREGGVLCGPCAAEDRGGLWLGPGALRGLRYLAAAGPEVLRRVRVQPATMAEMDQALGRHVGAILQRPLRSRALLDALTAEG